MIPNHPYRELPVNFIAIDFETANAARSSPCAIGLAEVRGGRVVGSESMIIRPPDGHDFVHPFNEMIHGISQAEVDAAPDFADVWPQIRSAIDGQVIVAHNAGFDTGVLRATLDVIGEPWPEVDYLCTMVISRRVLNLHSYRLPFITEALGIPFDDHHEAGADAIASAEVLLRLLDIKQASDFDALLSSIGVVRGTLRRDAWRGCRKASSSPLVMGQINAEADPAHALYGMQVCFTGALQTMGRQEAWELLCMVGGVPDKSVTKKTNVLVVGTQNPHLLRPGATQSSKEVKAAGLRAAGHEIEIMGEDDFVALVGDLVSGGERVR